MKNRLLSCIRFLVLATVAGSLLSTNRAEAALNSEALGRRVTVESILSDPQHPLFNGVQSVWRRILKIDNNKGQGSGVVITTSKDGRTGVWVSAGHVAYVTSTEDHAFSVERKQMVSKLDLKVGKGFVQTPTDFDFVFPVHSLPQSGLVFGGRYTGAPGYKLFLSGNPEAAATRDFVIEASVLSFSELLPFVNLGHSNPNELVFLIGYPFGGYQMEVVPFRVASPEQANSLISQLEIQYNKHREEGKKVNVNPPDLEREVILVAQRYPSLDGFSGGGVFNLRGDLIGVLSRGAFVFEANTGYIRVPLLNHILATYKKNSAFEDEKLKFMDCSSAFWE